MQDNTILLFYEQSSVSMTWKVSNADLASNSNAQLHV